MEETGGCRIGSFTATWPFASLKVDAYKIELNASVKGKLVFKRSDIVSIEPASNLFSGGGIKITHHVEGYNPEVVFTSSKSGTVLIQLIQQTGFLNVDKPIPQSIDNEITALQKASGSPIRLPVIIGVIVIWNGLFLADFLNLFHHKNKGDFFFGTGVSLALAFVFTLCLLTLLSDFVRQMVLKQGHEVKEIKYFLYFIMFIMAFLFTITSLII